MRDDFDEKEFAKFDAWCDRKALERHERYMAAKAERKATGGASDDATGGVGHKAASEVTAPATTPANLTSDPRYADTF